MRHLFVGAVLMLIGIKAFADVEFSIGDCTFYGVPDHPNEVVITNNNYESTGGALVIPGIVTNEGVTYAVTIVANFSYTGYSSITFPTTIREIYPTTFSYCENLKEVTLPSSLEILGSSTFNGCINLKKAEIPDNVKEMGTHIFSGCESLEEVKLPSHLKELPAFTFIQCGSLKNIDLPQTLTKIGDYALAMCMSLESVRIPDGVNEIGDAALLCCYSLASVRLPQSLKVLGQRVFEMMPDEVHQSQLKDITIDPENKYFSVEDGYLYNYDKTALYCVPSGKKVKRLDIPESVEVIKESAGAFNEALEVLNLPASVKEIEAGAFTLSSGLQEIYSMNPVPPSLVWNSFAVCPEEAVVYVPEGASTAYKSHEYWSYFKNIREIGDPSGIEEISGGDLTDDIEFPVNVYTLDGKFVMKAQSAGDLGRIAPGLYIAGQRKFIIR